MNLDYSANYTDLEKEILQELKYAIHLPVAAAMEEIEKMKAAHRKAAHRPVEFALKVLVEEGLVQESFEYANGEDQKFAGYVITRDGLRAVRSLTSISPRKF
jgi:hypothetical protein